MNNLMGYNEDTYNTQPLGISITGGYDDSDLNSISNHNKNNHNGRVDIQGPNIDQFQLFQNPGVNYNETTSYRGAMTGNWEDNILSDTFFSVGNIKILQNGIRAGVYKMSNGRYNVAPQDETNLKIIMRSIFLQFAKNQQHDIKKQIQDLNNKVLEYCIPEVHNEAISYIKYRQDVSTLPVPEARPTFISTKGETTLEMKPWF